MKKVLKWIVCGALLPALAVGALSIYICYDPNGITALSWAVIRGNPSRVRALLWVNPGSMNAGDSNGWTPLHRAVLAGNLEIARMLISKGADLNRQDRELKTPLHVAVLDGRREIAKALIAAGADVGSRDGRGRTPLHHACTKGDCELLRLLEARGANIDEPDNESLRPLHIVLRERHFEAARLLVRGGADVNVMDGRERTTMHYALQTGEERFALLILSGGFEKARLMDRHGGYLRNPLHEAVRLGWKDTVKALLDIGYDVNLRDKHFWGWPVPILGVRAHDGEMLELLISRGADVNGDNAEDGDTLMHRLARGDDVRMLRILIRNGGAINARNFEGRTPYVVAVHSGQWKTAEFLRFHGGKP